MDIYGLFDMIAILLAVIVAIKMKNMESINLLLFFITSSILSLAIFETDYFIYWPAVLMGLCVGFGSVIYKHPITLGYAAYLILIGFNAYTPVSLYSEYILLIYAYQLWVVMYGRDHGHYIGSLWRSNSHSSRNKDMEKGKS